MDENSTAAADGNHSNAGPSLLGIVEAVQVLFYYIILANGILGVINNTLSALVFVYYRSKFPPSCLYFIVLSVADFFCCWFLCVLFWTGESMRQMGGRGFDLFTLSLPGCRSLRYLQQIFISVGAYSVVALSYERAACLLSPVRFRSFFTVRRRIVLLLCVVLVAGVLWTQTFIAFDIRVRFVNSSLTGCYPSTSESVSFIIAYSYQMIFVNYTVPALLIIGGNVLAFVGYRLNRFSCEQQSQGLPSNNSPATTQSTLGENGVKITMALLSLQYLVLNLPYSVSWPLFSFFKYYNYELSNPTLFYNASYLNSIFMVLSTMNFSVNFYFYLFKVRGFRRRLIRLLSCGQIGRECNSFASNVNAASSAAAAAAAAVVAKPGSSGLDDQSIETGSNYRLQQRIPCVSG